MEQNKARCWAAVLLHDISPQQQRPWSQHVRNKATRWTSEPQQEVRLFVDLWTGNTQQVLISNRVQIQTCVYQHLYIWAHRELSWTHFSPPSNTTHLHTVSTSCSTVQSLQSGRAFNLKGTTQEVSEEQKKNQRMVCDVKVRVISISWKYETYQTCEEEAAAAHTFTTTTHSPLRAAWPPSLKHTNSNAQTHWLIIDWLIFRDK